MEDRLRAASPAGATPDSFPLAFLVIYALSYMPMALNGTFMPVYLGTQGMGPAAIGTLMSVSPFVALVAQPAWGLVADRAANRSRVLVLLLGGSAVTGLLLILGQGFVSWFVLLLLFLLFQMSVSPLQDAITLQHLERTRGSWGPIRLAGTLGYAAMASVGGMILERDLRLQFPIIAGLYAAGAVAALFLPASSGRTDALERPRPTALLGNRRLVVMLAFTTVIASTTFFYFVFFPIHFVALGGSRTLLGWSTVAAAVPEIFVLLVADRLLRRFGIARILAMVAAVTAVRWVLVFLVSSPAALIGVQLIHGVTFVPMLFAVARYVSASVPAELRASGQAFIAVMVTGIGRILGGMAGGALGQYMGIRAMFLVNGLVCAAAAAALATFILVRRRRASGGRAGPAAPGPAVFS